MNKLLRIGLFIIFILSFMDFMLMGTTLLIVAYVYLLFMKRKKMIMNTDSFLLLLYGILYYLFFIININMSLIGINGICFYAAYNSGVNLIKEDNETAVYHLILLCVLAYSMHGLFSFVYNFVDLGGINGILSAGRIMKDVWTGDLSSATGQAMLFTGVLALLYYMVFLNKKKIIKLLWLGLFIVAYIYNLGLAGRSFMAMSVIALISGLVINIILIMNEKKNISAVKDLVRIIIVVFIVLIVIFVMYKNDVMGLKTMFSDSSLGSRLETSDGLGSDSRWERKAEYLSHLLDYPFGGNHIRIDLHIGYAHDLWLDTYDYVGVVPTILLMIYTIRMIMRNVQLISMRGVSVNFRCMIIVFTLVTLVQCFIEPVAHTPIYLSMMFFVDGCVSKFINGRKKENDTYIL